MQKRAVVLGGEEKKARDLMQKLTTMRNEKQAKRSAKQEERRKVYRANSALVPCPNKARTCGPMAGSKTAAQTTASRLIAPKRYCHGHGRQVAAKPASARCSSVWPNW